MVDLAQIDAGRIANVLLVFDGGECYEHYLSLGLGFFHTLIKASHEDQMRMLRENSSISLTSLSNTLEEQDRGWEIAMYNEWAIEATLDFERDSDKDGPNAAWTWSTGHKDEIHYHHFSKKGLRKWGYVMWGKERLDQWSILRENIDEYRIWKQT